MAADATQRRDARLGQDRRDGQSGRGARDRGGALSDRPPAMGEVVSRTIAAPRMPSSPEDDDWLQFVAAAVNRYGPEGGFWPITSGAEQISVPISHWQLWNTANDDGKATSYGALLEATYRTIKLADPDAEVVTGALSFAGGKGTVKPTSFLRGLLRTSGKNSFSAVGVRPLARSVGSVKGQVKDVRRVLDSTGHVSDGIWVAPIGWASDRRSSKAVSVGPRAEEPTEVGDEVAAPRPRRRGSLLGALA